MKMECINYLRISTQGRLQNLTDYLTDYLKQLAAPPSPIVTKLFQHSINTSGVSLDWREACICLVFKNGKTTSPLNYRPIALTSVLGKQIEHIIAKNLRNFLDSKEILVDEHLGSGQNAAANLN